MHEERVDDGMHLPFEMLRLVRDLSSPWTNVCMSLTCKTLLGYSEYTSLQKYSGPMTISDITVVEIVDSSTLFFKCDSPYGKDQAAHRRLCLIDDYWACKGQAGYKSVISTSYPNLFKGRVQKGYTLTGEKLQNSDRTPDIVRGDWLKDVTVYVSPEIRSTTSRIDVKIKGWVTIEQIAMQTLTFLQDWSWEKYKKECRHFHSYESFLKYKYLEHVVGQEEASKQLMLFTHKCTSDLTSEFSFLNRNVFVFESSHATMLRVLEVKVMQLQQLLAFRY